MYVVYWMVLLKSAGRRLFNSPYQILSFKNCALQCGTISTQIFSIRGAKNYAKVDFRKRQGASSKNAGAPMYIKERRSVKVRKELEGNYGQGVILKVAKDMCESSQTEHTLVERGLPMQTFEHISKEFLKKLESSLSNNSDGTTELGIPTMHSLTVAYNQEGEPGLRRTLETAILSFGFQQSFSASQIDAQQDLSDLTHPREWYPLARQIKRQIHLHVGPTNSGKTYTALKRLEQAQNGWYAGPLRLLAHEIFTRLNANNISCNLITGEERRIVDPAARVTSATVEMTDLNCEIDVAVLDEIQMIGDYERGWAWTHAFLGMRAKELHLCGDPSVIELIKKLSESTNDDLHIHRYERLGPLEQVESLSGKFSRIRPGDCVVTFNRKNIFAIKRAIEEETNLKCAVVYGRLPPEVRVLQANLFNDPDSGYDVLVATDAVGMGLNLSIKRIIFEALTKSNGVAFVNLSISQIKQIAGRAGRYKVPQVAKDAIDDEITKDATTGYVTTLHRYDMNRLRICLRQSIPSTNKAGLHPNLELVEAFAAAHPPETPFSFILERLEMSSKITENYFLSSYKTHRAVADTIANIKKLSIGERYTFCCAPFNLRHSDAVRACKAMAKILENGTGGDIEQIPGVNLSLLKFYLPIENSSITKLAELESLHSILSAYIWLSYKFPAVYYTTEKAALLRDKCQNALHKELQAMKFNAKSLQPSFKTFRKE